MQMKKSIINYLNKKKYGIVGFLLVLISAELWASGTKIPTLVLDIVFIIGVALIIFSASNNLRNSLK